MIEINPLAYPCIYIALVQTSSSFFNARNPYEMDAMMV